ncbi:uncharacterized protein LOC107043588 [Diachasma alloeum]|uniref:uncharacterized protein LOC107043588 n=1 Tax=Diachasma alloeum TaxID=454923 RepID=UPI0007382D7E|nr:uncharacterized protein LOC107043588 [Diachasma alloeum]
MLKHIPTVQPSSNGSRNQHHHPHNHSIHLHHNDYGSQTIVGNHQHFTTGQPTTSSRLPRGCHDQSGIYDSLHPHPKTREPTVHRHPLTHSQLSVNNLSRLNHSHGLNLSTLSTSKHSIDSASPVVGNDIHPSTNHSIHHYHHHLGHGVMGSHLQDRPQVNGGLDISRVLRLPSQTTPSPPVPVHPPVAVQQIATISGTSGQVVPVLDNSWTSFCLKGKGGLNNKNPEDGVKEMLTFLGLLCLVSLLLAMLSHIFLLKMSPLSVTPSSLISPEEYTIVYEVTLGLCALALSLNLCCLLVCAIQFLFAMKLVKSSYNQSHRTNMYLQKSSLSRMCAVGGFFVSIPVFLTGMILYTFIQFHSTPAIVMSVFIGLGIVFCGCAMVHNVFVWQREKTNAVKALARAQCEAAAQLQRQQQMQQAQQQATIPRGTSTIPRGNCTIPKHINSTLPHHPRGSHPQTQVHQQSHDVLRHAQMSPVLLTLSASPAAHNHSSIDVHRVPASPPTTPAGDRTPTSPVNKSINRSQHQMREASGSVSPGMPTATLDLSSAANTNSPHELSTLV